MIWNPRKVTLDILSSNNSWLSNRVSSIKTNLHFILVNIYGPTTNHAKYKYWMKLVLSSTTIVINSFVGW